MDLVSELTCITSTAAGTLLSPREDLKRVGESFAWGLVLTFIS